MNSSAILVSSAPSRAPIAGRPVTRSGRRLLPGRVVAYAWLLGGVPIAVLQLVHADLHEHNELPPILHWLRDAGLAVPAAAIAVVMAALVVGRLGGETRSRATLTMTLGWAVLAGVLFALLSMPGNVLHATLFGAEEEAGVSLEEDLLADANYALQAALLMLVPASLLIGVPWRGPRPMAEPRAAAEAATSHPAAAAASPMSHESAASTDGGGNR